MAEFYSILTTVGLAKIAAAQAGGDPVVLTEFAVGDSGGTYFDPVEGQVSLVNEVWRGDLSRLYTHAAHDSWVVAEAFIPLSDGGFEIREAGVFDADGDLIAVSKYPLTEKPAVGSGGEKDVYVRLTMEVTNATSVTHLIDSSVAMATVQYVDSHADRTDNPHEVTASQVIDAGSAILEDAQESLTDITLNRLMRVGAFGIGLSGVEGFAVPKMAGGVDVSTDWNTITKGGWWNKVLGTGSVNKPAGGTGYWYCLALSNDVTGAVTQIAFPYGVSENPGTIKYRTLHSGTWTDWIELLHTNNTGTAVTEDVQESKVDTTEGRLLTVGAFGLGSAGVSSVSDLDSALIAGFYAYTSTTSNLPSGLFEKGGVFVTTRYGDPSVFQIAVDMYGVVASRGYGSGTGWSAWKTILHDGDVQAELTDDTAGKLMTVGAFGLGNAGAAQAAVLDNTKTAGQYRYQSTDPDVPEAGAYGPFYVYVNSSTAITQVAFRNSSADMWIRYWNGSVWSSWVKIYHTGNFATNKLLATNGYQELPGGLIMQWGIYTGTLASGGSVTLTLPTTFPNAAFVATMSERGTDIIGTSSSQLYTATESTITLYNRTDAPRSGIGYHIFGY